MQVRSPAEIAALVRDSQQRFGLMQTELALISLLGVSYQSVNRWENGRNIPPLVDLKLIEGMLKQTGDHDQDLLSKHFDYLC